MCSCPPVAISVIAAIALILLSASAFAETSGSSGITRLPGPIEGTSVYQRSDAPEKIAACIVGPYGLRLLQPLEPAYNRDWLAGFGVGWWANAPLALTPALSWAMLWQLIARSGETHFGMPVVDGEPRVETRAYSGETHFGFVLDELGRIWWAIAASGETHFGRPLPDGSMRWQTEAPPGARTLVPVGAPLVDSDAAGCRAAASKTVEMALH